MSFVSRFALLAPNLVLAAACGEDPQSGGAGPSLEERARAIHERVVTVDTHDDINTRNFTVERNYTMDLPTQVTLPKMEAGGLDVPWFIVYTGQGPLTEEGYAAAYANAIDKFEAIGRLTTELAPDRIELALTSGDARRIVSSGKMAAMIGVENAYPLGTDLSRIEEFHQRGARYMSLAHTGPSQFSDAHNGEVFGEWMHDGLSELGRRAVALMNRLGIVIDVSHPSKASIMQTLELSRAPVMASHSSARALSDVTRNLDDEQLLAIAEGGGVVHAVALRRFVHAEKAAARTEAIAAATEARANEMGLNSDSLLSPGERRERAAALMQRVARELGDSLPPDVDVSDFVDHIDYMVQLIGIDHVGISSDFDGGGGVLGWDDASETFNVTLELVRRGYTEEEIGKLWGGNLFRVLDEAQAVALEIQAEER